MSSTRLPRALWLVVLGILLNYLGYGAGRPFEVIYLHDGGGFGLGAAGVVVGLITGVAVLTAPLAGPVIDRYGARIVAAGGGVALAMGYAGMAVGHSLPVALVAAAVAGAGDGAPNPSQSTRIPTVVPPELRHRSTAVSRVAANVGAGLGGGIGGVVASGGVTGFVLLFLANAASYLVFVGILLVSVREPAPPTSDVATTIGYADVLRDRTFLRLAAVNVAMISVGWGVFTWLVPPYAEGWLGLSTRAIGLLLLANAAAVAVAQVPIARLAEGHRRSRLMALAGGLFVGACLLVLAARPGGPVYPLLLAAVIVVGIGECCHTTVLMPLVADLAPAAARGRYMATAGLSWWVGLALAPVLGGPILGAAPAGAFLVAAAVAGWAALSALTLERRIPVALLRTPSPDGPQWTIRRRSARESA